MNRNFCSVVNFFAAAQLSGVYTELSHGSVSPGLADDRVGSVTWRYWQTVA